MNHTHEDIRAEINDLINNFTGNEEKLFNGICDVVINAVKGLELEYKTPYDFKPEDHPIILSQYGQLCVEYGYNLAVKEQNQRVARIKEALQKGQHEQ